jgi:hypothetical protein
MGDRSVTHVTWWRPEMGTRSRSGAALPARPSASLGLHQFPSFPVPRQKFPIRLEKIPG